jgi:hypothetical protein
VPSRRLAVAAIGTEEPLAVAVVEAIRGGDLPAPERLLAVRWLATLVG